MQAVFLGTVIFAIGLIKWKAFVLSVVTIEVPCDLATRFF